MSRTAERGRTTIPGQVRMNLCTGDLIVPFVPMTDIEQRESKVELKDEKPSIAFINNENLEIIKSRILKNCWPIDISSDKELIKQLVVFQYGTRIKRNPKEEILHGYTVNLNIGVIACKSNDLVNDYETPFGYSEYRMLGVYASFKATGNNSTDKSLRGYATIQRSDTKKHPDFLYNGECFFAQSKDKIEVKKSIYEKTGYWWKK